MSHIKYRNLLIALALFGLAALSSFSSNTVLSDFKYVDSAGVSSIVKIPFTVLSPNNDSTYVVSGKLQLDTLSPRSLRIIPDDELRALRVNGTEVDLSSISKASLKDWGHGFSINLAEYLHTGENELLIELGDHGGNFGLKIATSIEDWRGALPTLLWILATSFLMLWIAFRAGLTSGYAIAIISGIALRLFYLATTNYETRTHDVAAHLEYINHFVHAWVLPPLDSAQGGAYFHPPFYYFIVSLFQSAVSALVQGDVALVYRALQWLSTTLSFGFLLFGLLIIQQVSHYFQRAEDTTAATNIKQLLFVIASVLFACWPSAVLHSIRISNDAFLYLFFAGGMYYLMAWSESRSWRDLWFAALFAALATMSKANGVVLVPVAACMLFAAWWQAGFSIKRSVAKKIALLMLPPLIGAAIAFYPGVALKLQGKRTHTYVSNINNVGADQIVGNEAQNLLWFDVKMFVTEPFTSPWDDKMGRQYFGNYLGKTGLFGEWRFNGGLARNSAVIISFCFLILSALILYGFYRMPRSGLARLSPLILTAGFLLAAISHMRMSFPVNVDFRYILPIIICYSVFAAAAHSVFVDTGRMRLVIIGVATQLLFLISTLTFFFGVIGAN